MSKLPNLSELQECPHCGSVEYYTKQRVKGEIYYRERFDGDCAENTHTFDSISTTWCSKFVYCVDCEVKIAKDDRE